MNANLHAAIRASSIKDISAALDGGVDPNCTDANGDCALTAAIETIDSKSVRLHAVRMLLKAGALTQPLQQDESVSPLFAAMIAYDPAVLKVLLEAGADPNLEQDLGEPLFDWAEFHYRHEEHDLNVPGEPTDADQRSSASWLRYLSHFASQEGRVKLECLNLLLQYGANGWRERQNARAQSGKGGCLTRPPHTT